MANKTLLNWLFEQSLQGVCNLCVGQAFSLPFKLDVITLLKLKVV